MFIPSGELVTISRTDAGQRGSYLRSLKFRIMILMILIGIVPTVIVAAVVIRNYEQRAVTSRSVTVKNQCDIIANKLVKESYFKDQGNENINAQFKMLTSIYGGRILVINKDYRVIKDTYNLANRRYILSPKVIDCFSGEESSVYNSDDHFVELTVKITDPDSTSDEIIGVMLVSFSTKEIDYNSQFMQRQGLMILGILVAVIIVGGYLLAGLLVAPFDRITRAIRATKGDLLTEMQPVRTYEETEQISSAFNKLISQVNVLNESRSEFVANVSHELKTPLASMKVLADSIIMNPDTTQEEYREFMYDISSEIDRENAIINDLLSLVRMEKRVDDLNVTETNVNELLELIVKRLKPIADKANVELRYECFRPVTAQIDETKIALVMTNLIENGIKYNKPEGGWVNVALNSDQSFMYLTVSDSGIGIPEESLDHIFERFYRVDKSHSREIGGTGLGLAITKSAITMHNGAIKVTSTEGEGSSFLVRIPLTHIDMGAVS